MRRPQALEVALALVGLATIALSHLLARTGPAGWSPTERTPDLVRAATWNLGGSLGGGTPPLQDAWIAPLATRLRALDLDLALLQEVHRASQLQRLCDQLGDGWTALSRRSGDRRVAILARGGRLREVRTGDATGRVLLARWERSDGSFLIGALHASATSSRERHAAILELLDATEAGGLEAALLGGDFNLDVTLDGRADLFTDDERRDVDAYARLTERYRDLGLGSGPTAEPDRRLDYLFGSQAFEVSGAGPVLGLREPGMDHDPVVADLRLRRR
ncbi:MAG: endonuclease/exonuclease/phosphatase family protein [Planctomycetota bacterium]